VAFTPKVPGTILPVDVRIFGGEGFLLQHITGNCHTWVALGGEIVNPTLQAGETLLVHPGHVGMFEDSVTFDITTISGIKNALFGVDGIFLVRLTGPGRVWLQTMTVPTLAHALAPFMGRSETTTTTTEVGVGAGVAGSAMRGIFGGGR
jgi:uncharacterized protein (AIM24 family)